jgi:hypothetical protein
VKGRSVRSAGNVLTTLSCSASGIFAIFCSQQGRADPANSTSRWSHCAYAILADFIICMCEFDFRQAHARQIVRVVDLPFGKRPFRVSIRRRTARRSSAVSPIECGARCIAISDWKIFFTQ